MGKVIIGGAAYVLVAAVLVYRFPGLTGPVVVVTFIAAALTLGRQVHKRKLARNEALFASMFPDLQPHYHPQRLYDYVVARLGGKIPRGSRVKDPPGFPGCSADVRVEDKREIVRILDDAGRLLTQFFFEKHAEGAAIRVGKGKFTVSTGNPQKPRVRYWHPDREFKWTPLAWQFKTPVADRPFESSDQGSSFSTRDSSPSSSSSSSSSGAASAAAFAAAGGAFDGGGASQSWSDGGAGDDAGGASAAATSY